MYQGSSDFNWDSDPVGLEWDWVSLQVILEKDYTWSSEVVYHYKHAFTGGTPTVFFFFPLGLRNRARQFHQLGLGCGEGRGESDIAQGRRRRYEITLSLFWRTVKSTCQGASDVRWYKLQRILVFGRKEGRSGWKELMGSEVDTRVDTTRGYWLERKDSRGSDGIRDSWVSLRTSSRKVQREIADNRDEDPEVMKWGLARGGAGNWDRLADVWRSSEAGCRVDVRGLQVSAKLRRERGLMGRWATGSGCTE